MSEAPLATVVRKSERLPGPHPQVCDEGKKKPEIEGDTASRHADYSKSTCLNR